MAERNKGRGPDVPDGIELHKDGTATLSIDNQRWRMRRPKLGEFRKIRELMHRREDERLRLIAENPAIDELDKDADTEAKLAYTNEVNERARGITDAIVELNIEWLTEVFTMLCDAEPPPPDDWPSGLEQNDTIDRLVKHWREVPLRSGGG